MADILVLVAHPQLRQSRVNAALLREAAALAAADRDRLAVHDLYARYPDYVIDVAAEQAALAAARLVVWQHPLHWYGMPPMMKLWLDEVFAFGWAYGPQGHALRGKWLWPVLSTGGAEESYRSDGYNRHSFEAFLPPYAQTAALCGMGWVPPLVLHGAHRVSESALREHAVRYRQRLEAFPAGLEADAAPPGATEVPASARPADGA
jgi:glutathione-regulated potassium-efflux system ancillary protein KefF